MLLYDASNETSEATSSAPRADLRAALAEETVDVADHDGRIIRVNRRDWLEKVLMPNLRAARGDLEHLYELLVGAVVDGFAGDVIEHAKFLAKHDATPPRGVALLGAVFLASGRVNDAHRELMNGLELHGEDALLLCNLARVFDAREDRPRTDATLWRSLTLDPNLDFAFAWFLDRAADSGQDGSIREACERVAALPGSWRARVVLAGAALRANNATGASRLHDEALLCAPKPVPSDLLLQMSGNLGKAGLLQELVDRVGPRFDARFHNFFIGANLPDPSRSTRSPPLPAQSSDSKRTPTFARGEMADFFPPQPRKATIRGASSIRQSELANRYPNDHVSIVQQNCPQY